MHGAGELSAAIELTSTAGRSPTAASLTYYFGAVHGFTVLDQQCSHLVCGVCAQRTEAVRGRGGSVCVTCVYSDRLCVGVRCLRGMCAVSVCATVSAWRVCDGGTRHPKSHKCFCHARLHSPQTPHGQRDTSSLPRHSTPRSRPVNRVRKGCRSLALRAHRHTSVPVRVGGAGEPSDQRHKTQPTFVASSPYSPSSESCKGCALRCDLHEISALRPRRPTRPPCPPRRHPVSTSRTRHRATRAWVRARMPRHAAARSVPPCRRSQ